MGAATRTASKSNSVESLRRHLLAHLPPRRFNHRRALAANGRRQAKEGSHAPRGGTDRRCPASVVGSPAALHTVRRPGRHSTTGLVMLAWTWRTWPDPLVDYGREAYLAWQVAKGKTLYVDVAHFNGPRRST